MKSYALDRLSGAVVGTAICPPPPRLLADAATVLMSSSRWRGPPLRQSMHSSMSVSVVSSGSLITSPLDASVLSNAGCLAVGQFSDGTWAADSTPLEAELRRQIEGMERKLTSLGHPPRSGRRPQQQPARQPAPQPQSPPFQQPAAPYRPPRQRGLRAGDVSSDRVSSLKSFSNLAAPPFFVLKKKKKSSLTLRRNTTATSRPCSP
jgi:hypothetical protein